ncbi:MAG: hypothetical protein HC892_01005 [Saprospiraceae bacterium]|nr:hypothetical protein [Saprospiraceae bacterium]
MESSALAILHLSSARTWRGGEQQIAYLVETLHQQQIQQYIFCVEDSPLAHWCRAQHFPSMGYKKRSAFDLKVAKQIRAICKEKTSPMFMPTTVMPTLLLGWLRNVLAILQLLL